MNKWLTLFTIACIFSTTYAFAGTQVAYINFGSRSSTLDGISVNLDFFEGINTKTNKQTGSGFAMQTSGGENGMKTMNTINIQNLD